MANYFYHFVLFKLRFTLREYLRTFYSVKLLRTRLRKRDVDDGTDMKRTCIAKHEFMIFDTHVSFCGTRKLTS